MPGLASRITTKAHIPRERFFYACYIANQFLWWAVWGHRKVRRVLCSRLRQPCTVHHHPDWRRKW
ncbi:hypothetical protein YA42_00545 [Enterobacter hormaechei subsp. oharae]|nr:hypothetical protein YA42_00545 [Enterobacter hormaechei subsp. oharae]